jgi:hypothetical protein
MRAPALTRRSEAALNPLIGKSLVIYAAKTDTAKPISPNGSVFHATAHRSPPANGEADGRDPARTRGSVPRRGSDAVG